MAFMMPVMKNDWDIYKSNRSRKSSETSQSSRSRKVSESRSENGVCSPGGSLGSPAHRSVPAMMGARPAARAPRPARSLSCSPPAPPADKFSTRLMDKLRRTLQRKERSPDEERSS